MGPIYTPLHLMHCKMTAEQVKRMREILAIDPMSLHRPNQPSLIWPIMSAAVLGHIDCLELFLEQSVDLNVRDHKNRTVMYYAVKGGNADCVNLLATRGASVAIEPGDERNKYLELACSLGYGKVVYTLLIHGAIPLVPTVAGSEIVHSIMISIRVGNLECFKWLAVFGAIRRYPMLSNDLPLIIARESAMSYEKRVSFLNILYLLGYNINSCMRYEPIIPYIKPIISKPLPLLALTRIKLHQAIGERQYVQTVKDVKFPPYNLLLALNSLIEYLNFKDV